MRIAAVDHSFHAKTKSTEFIFDILAECGTVERFYCERWKGGPAVDLRALRRGRYDAIVFIQQMYRRQELRQLGDSRKTVLLATLSLVSDRGVFQHPAPDGDRSWLPVQPRQVFS